MSLNEFQEDQVILLSVYKDNEESIRFLSRVHNIVVPFMVTGFILGYSEIVKTGSYYFLPALIGLAGLGAIWNLGALLERTRIIILNHAIRCELDNLLKGNNIREDFSLQGNHIISVNKTTGNPGLLLMYGYFFGGLLISFISGVWIVIQEYVIIISVFYTLFVIVSGVWLYFELEKLLKKLYFDLMKSYSENQRYSKYFNIFSLR